MIFEAAVIFLGILWVLSLILFLSYSKRQRLMVAQLAEGNTLRDLRLKELAKRLDDYQSGTIRMGEDLHELRSVMGPVPDKLAQLEQRDPTSLSFAQAARLVGMGASVDELTVSCGLTQAEAQLMSKLHGNSAG